MKGKRFFAAVFFAAFILLAGGRSVSASVKYIMMGDSYSARRNVTAPNAWPDYVMKQLNLNPAEVRVERLSGYGFIRDGRKFVVRLNAIPDSKAVRKIILVGGMGNDYHAEGGGTRSRIENAMERFDEIAARKFPNADIMYSAPNWGTGAFRQKLCRTRTPWYREKSRALGWQYLENTEYSLRVTHPETMFLEDGIHPNKRGQARLGLALSAAIRSQWAEGLDGKERAESDDGAGETAPVSEKIKARRLLLPEMSLVTPHSIRLIWEPVEGAASYEIYGNLLTLKLKKLQTLSASRTAAERGGLESGKCCKYVVCAYDRNHRQIARSRELHIVTPKSKYTNCNSVSFTRHSTALREGTSITIMASEAFADSGKKPYPASNGELRYISDTPEIADFLYPGVLAGIRKGTCRIYAVSQSGIYDMCTVTVR